MRAVPWLLLLLAAALRLLVCLRTEVPGRDGASYLWMAERFAAGEPGALFQTVFHPLYPALTGLLLAIAPGLDPVAAGQLVAAGCGALALLPLWAAAAALFGAKGANWAGLCYALGAWFARHPAECLSEGPFYLLAAGWAFALVGGRTRAVLAGAAAGLAYLARPEGAALLAVGAVHCWARGQRRAALRLLLAGLPVAALLPLGFALWGEGPTLSPKAAFNYEVGIGGAGSPAFHYLRELLALPGSAFEELGWITLPLALAGALRWRPRRLADPAAVLLLPFLLQCAVVPLLRSHWRFLSGFGLLLLPFAGQALARLLAALGRRRRWLPVLPVALLLLAEARILAPRNSERAVERELGRYLGSQLGPGELLASDMPRLCYFAGRKPPPPRPIAAAEILAQAKDPACRFVAVVRGRTDLETADLAELGLEPALLPGHLLAATGRRGVLVFAKRAPR